MARILCVEADKAVMETFSQVLTAEKHAMIKAVDGVEAMAKLKNEDFDLIITDLNFPKIKGKRLVEVIQENKNFYECPILIASSEVDNNIINSFSGISRIHFLPKPIVKKDLVEMIFKLIYKKPLPPTIDVRFVNPILESTLFVITSITDFKITVGKPFIKTSGEVSGDISGMVGIVSTGFKGSISLSFFEDGFLKVLTKMIKEECKEITEENKDAVAELLNIIFGRAKKTLNDGGMDIQPAIPSIVRGKNHSIDHATKHPTIVIPFNSPEIGDFRSEVSFS